MVLKELRCSQWRSSYGESVGVSGGEGKKVTNRMMAIALVDEDALRIIYGYAPQSGSSSEKKNHSTMS